ncbi:MAG: M12 family metallo-peptidase [Methylococcaceae bacterium]
MQLKNFIGISLIAATLLPWAVNAKGKGPAPDMFDDYGIQQIKKAMPKKGMRMRSVNVNTDLMITDTVTLNLFDDVIVTAVRDKLIDNVKGHTTWIGHVEGEADSEVFLTMHGHTISGLVQIGANTYEINSKGKNQHEIMQINSAKNPKHSESKTVDDFLQSGALPEPDTATSTSTTPPTAQAAAAGTVIDLMVAYTTKAKNNASGQAGIEAKITNAVAMANQAYINSKIDMQLNLVKMVETNYTETGDMSKSLTDLTGTSDGKMDELHSLRNQYGADQVSLLTADTNYCGIAYVMTSSFVGRAFAPYAFSVVHDDSVYACLSGQTLAHELGHNQGNNHDRDNSGSSPGAYSYSYAYRLCQNAGFRTIMAYACSGGTRVSYFSNPNVALTNGNATGTPTENNALSMNNTKAVVAAFRATATTTVIAPPSAPTNLVASAFSSSQINLTWADNSNDEIGFRLERSADAINWTEFAITNNNVTSFSDTGLVPSTQYLYRVRAYSSNGNSSYSNTVAATTAAQVVCNSNAAKLTVNPTSVLGKTSATVALSVLLSNNDSAGCNATTFTLVNNDGGTIGAFSLAPGSSSNITWSLSLPATDGVYNKSVTASAANHSTVTASTSVTTDGTPPTAPADLKVLLLRRGIIGISWGASTDAGSGVDHYEISRNGTKIANTTSLSFNDKTSIRGTITYTVSAFDKTGNSVGSSKSINL